MVDLCAYCAYTRIMKMNKPTPKPTLRSQQTRVCMYVDNKVLEAIKKLAEKEGMKYQPYINWVLRRFVRKNHGI